MPTEIIDNLTTYLELLKTEINREDYRRVKFLDEAARELVEIVDEIIPKWNPNLMYSGHEEEFWNYFNEEGISSLEIVYTGFTGEGMGEPDDIAVYWEFGKKHLGGYNDILARDYAYYIEFGKDRFAPNAKLKAPDRPPAAFLSSALLDMDEIVEYYAQEWIDLVLSKVA